MRLQRWMMLVAMGAGAWVELGQPAQARKNSANANNNAGNAAANNAGNASATNAGNAAGNNFSNVANDAGNAAGGNAGANSAPGNNGANAGASNGALNAAPMNAVGNASLGNSAGNAAGNGALSNSPKNAAGNAALGNGAPINPVANSQAGANGNAAKAPANAAPANAAPLNAAPLNATNAAPSNANLNQIPAAAPLNASSPPAAAPGGPVAAAPPAAAGQAPSAPPSGTGPLELRYRFDHRPPLPLHTFVLKWASPTGNLQSIDVMITDSKQVLQTIPVPQDRVHLVWQDIISKPGHTKDIIVDAVDYNFDKFPDLRLTSAWPYRAGDKLYMIWLFNDKTNKYELSEPLSALPAAVPNAKTQRLSSIKLTGYAGGEYEQTFYSVSGKGPTLKLLPEVVVVTTALDPHHLSFQRDVRKRQTGADMVSFCKIRVPAEGRPKRLFGDAEDCAPYLVKDAPAPTRRPPAAVPTALAEDLTKTAKERPKAPAKKGEMPLAE